MNIAEKITVSPEDELAAVKAELEAMRVSFLSEYDLRTKYKKIASDLLTALKTIQNFSEIEKELQ